MATDLRVSLTDRCNLRCSYCMPAEGLDWLPGDDVLTDDEVVRLVGIGVRLLGVQEVRFTGGEPLVRRGLVDIVRRSKELNPDVDLSITTNALGLSRNAHALKAAGLDRVNVSLDTIRPDTFLEITRRDRLQDVIDGLAAAQDAGPGAGEDQRGAAAGRQRRPGGRAAALVRSTTATTCGSSSRCRWTPSTAGAVRRWSPPTRSSSTSTASSC